MLDDTIFLARVWLSILNVTMIGKKSAKHNYLISEKHFLVEY